MTWCLVKVRIVGPIVFQSDHGRDFLNFQCVHSLVYHSDKHKIIVIVIIAFPHIYSWQPHMNIPKGLIKPVWLGGLHTCFVVTCHAQNCSICLHHHIHWNVLFSYTWWLVLYLPGVYIWDAIDNGGVMLWSSAVGLKKLWHNLHC